MFLPSSCSLVASHGEGERVHRGLMGQGQQWGGGNQRGGEMGAIVGGRVLGSSTSKTRPSHKYKSPKQFELKGSKST